MVCFEKVLIVQEKRRCPLRVSRVSMTPQLIIISFTIKDSPVVTVVTISRQMLTLEKGNELWAFI